MIISQKFITEVNSFIRYIAFIFGINKRCPLFTGEPDIEHHSYTFLVGHQSANRDQFHTCQDMQINRQSQELWQ